MISLLRRATPCDALVLRAAPGFAEGAAGRMAAAKERLEESVRLRRELGFTPGVAGGVLALAELAARDGKREEALALADEAGSIAEASDAEGALRWVEQFREELPDVR
jgi:hypothetical protein